MKNLLDNTAFNAEIAVVSQLALPWNVFENKSILIAGSTGMIGSYLIDVLMHKNGAGLNCRIIALGRNAAKAKARFSQYWDDPCFRFVEADINCGLPTDLERTDFVLHAASNTHPVAYATEPISTITTNIIGTNNLLAYASENQAQRVVFVSSVEVYGENRGDCEKFDESYCGYIDCNTLRAGYPESKRVGEALCQAYIKEKNLDIVIARLSRVYGPTMLMSDSKALSQFIKKGVRRENIVLKSAGTQYFSYCYTADAVTALLLLLAEGKCGEAYNVSDEKSDITLRDLSGVIAKHVGTQVVFEIPNAVESAGYSKATTAILDNRKLKELGWKPIYNIQKGLETTISILSDVYQDSEVK